MKFTVYIDCMYSKLDVYVRIEHKFSSLLYSYSLKLRWLDVQHYISSHNHVLALLWNLKQNKCIVKPPRVATSIKQSPVLRGHLFCHVIENVI
jgi:hypothetical protein